MKHTRFFVLYAVIIAVILAAHWMVSGPADAVTSDPLTLEEGTVKPGPFEYFPNQFVSKPADSGAEIPTF